MEKILNINNNIVKIFAETVESEVFEQVKKLASYPAYHNSKIRIMSDCHSGKGCTVGTTMTLTDKVTPNLVGVDIGCGMLVVKLAEKNIDFELLDKVIHKNIPSGFEIHTQPWLKTTIFDELLCGNSCDTKRALLSIGSLGGGNHFIEIDKDDNDNYYLVIHTGSRNLGVQVCKFYQDLAFKELNEMTAIKKKLSEEIITKCKAEGRKKDIQKDLKEAFAKLQKPSADKELAHLEGDNFKNYIHDMDVVQRYAVLNRSTIANIILQKMKWKEVERFETIHNYIDIKNMILRKGSVSAQKGEKLIIPINMRDGSLICIGKGNEDWNYSAPHGAGRLMSRSKAKANIELNDYKDSMKGIYTTCVNMSTIDESPMAYKSLDEIVRCIEPTVDIITRIIPVYNFKAGDSDN